MSHRCWPEVFLSLLAENSQCGLFVAGELGPMLSLRSRSLPTQELNFSSSTALWLSTGFSAWSRSLVAEVSSLKRLKHVLGLHSWRLKCSGTCRGAECCAVARQADWLVSEVEGLLLWFDLDLCTISWVSSVLHWKLCVPQPTSLISDLCTWYRRCSSCTWCKRK